MKTFLLLVISLLSVSCVSLTERQIHDLNTNVVTTENKAFAMGGKFANRWGVGSVWNGEKSFRDVLVIGASSSNSATYRRQVGIRNIAGTTALIGSVQTIGTDQETDAAWDIAVTANDTNDALKVEITGAAATTIRWMGRIEGVEFTTP